MFRPATFACLAVLVGFVAPSSPASATDSLAVPISTEMATATWPIRVAVEIVQIESDDDGAEPAMPKRTIVVPDGHRLDFASSVRSTRGRLDFDLAVVPRMHPRGAIELEWDLLVSEAKFRPMDVGGYVVHRLQLAGDPELGPSTLSIARSDIVSTTGETFIEEVEIEGQAFEIRILAESLRG